MPWKKHAFTINVTGDGIYVATRDYLLRHEYEPDPEWVPEVSIPPGKYGFVLEAPRTRRKALRATGSFNITSGLVIGDFTHVFPPSKLKNFLSCYDNHILRGGPRECVNLYMGEGGEYDVVLSLTKVG